MPSKSIALVTGGFDPIHKGHIRMFKEASKLGKVIVGLNSDKWLERKKLLKSFFKIFIKKLPLPLVQHFQKLVDFFFCGLTWELH